MKSVISLVLATLFVIACQSDPSGGNGVLNQLETAFNETPNLQNSRKLVGYIDSLISLNLPDDKANIDLRIKKADVLKKSNQYLRAKESYKEILRFHPKIEGGSGFAMELAHIYQNQLKNSTLANAVKSQLGNLFPDMVGLNEVVADIKDFDILANTDRLRDGMYNDSLRRIDRRVARDFIEISEIYGIFNNNKENTPDILDKAAETARSILDFNKAIELYDWLILKFPDSDKTAQAFFLKAFTLDNNLGKVDEARIYYEEFIRKYPDHEFADDTEFLLKNLGKSDEEIIKSFEEG
jgi:tetratricopeptide (TPR) repeat protein